MVLSAERAGYRSGALQWRGFERSVRAIEQFEPAVAREFARTTDVVLRDVKKSARGDAAWTSGLLNRTGAPLEFSFGTCSDHVRYTMEVGPDTAPEQRLGVIEALLRELGEDEWSGVDVRFREMQRGERLKFGAWLGVRHARGTGRTTYKIYADVPERMNGAASGLIAEYLGAASSVPGPASQLVLVGGAPGTDRCEFYFEIEGRQLTLSALRRMLAHAGLESRHEELVELIRWFQFRRDGAGDTLPEAQYGFSYSLLPGGGEPVFSVFVFAADLAGGDGFLRRQVLSAALSRGWMLGCYAAITEPLAQRYFRSAFHNMISFAVGSEAVGFQVSVSPPPELPEED